MIALVAAPALAHADAAWRRKADLDGDGKTDAITLALTAHDPIGADDQDHDRRVPIRCLGARCEAKLSVGTAELDLPITGGYFGGLRIEVIDIDPRDHRKELLITQRGEGEEDPPYDFTIVTYDGGKLVAAPLWTSGGYSTGTVKVRGGKVVVVYDDCPDRTTVTYARRGGKIVELGRKVLRTHPPESCAG